MKKVYTRTGDKGTTGIHGGARVPKDDIRIEANGCLDELNAVIGIVRSMLSAGDDRQELLHTIQKELMVVMSHVATPDDVLNPNLLSAAGLTVRCEQEMDAMTAGLTENGYFLLPGGTPVSAQLHFARTVARRAERRLWTLHRQSPLNEDILCFVNRLSDLFFVMARTGRKRNGRSLLIRGRGYNGSFISIKVLTVFVFSLFSYSSLFTKPMPWAYHSVILTVSEKKRSMFAFMV